MIVGSSSQTIVILDQALGSTPGGATFLSCPLPFQRSTDSDGPDCVFQLDTIGLQTMEESRPSDSSPCCDYACDLSYITTTVHIYNHTVIPPCTATHR